MVEETFNIIIDDDLIMDVNTGIIGSKQTSDSTMSTIPMEELMDEIDRVELAINDLESSLNSKSISRLSKPGREGAYYMAGFLSNVVLGIIIALIFIILLI